VNRLRNRLILIFLAATLAPLVGTVWFTTSLLAPRGLLHAVGEVDTLSQDLAQTGRELYQRACDDLKRQVQTGEAQPRKYLPADHDAWPDAVKSFAEGVGNEQFSPTGAGGDQVTYLVRHEDEIWSYSAGLGGVALERLKAEIAEGRELVDAATGRDLQRGFKLTYVLLAASFWLVSLILLVYMAHRTSQPIQRLTKGLSKLAAGDLGARVESPGDDEIGRAIQAFNHMADKLKESTERLVSLRQLSSWQTLARKTAHEVKNSLTPIRLTVEEMVARSGEADQGFLEQAAQIVVDEIESLERRVRAFSEFAAEPPVNRGELDMNSLLQERVAFLKTAHPEVAYDCRLTDSVPRVLADQDLVKGILTNLLENAAEAAGEGGRILALTTADNGQVAVEVHDSGPGLSEQARASLFQPTISFKKRGMGLGLSIARKSALLSGGDIVLVKGELGGAGFRVLLPVATNGIQARSDRG
jgi:two-component system, NtrC family, nitrogen regulation sensor histidine kinase NtrY